MDFLFFIIIAAGISYVIFLFTGESDEDLVQARLRQITSQKPEDNEVQQEEPKSSLIENLMKLVDPITSIIYKHIDPKSTKQLLLEAGLASGDEDVYKHVAKKVAFAVLGGLMAFILSISGELNPGLKMMLFIIIPLTCFRLPDFKLRRLAHIKYIEITYNLSDVLDLLTVCIESGLGLDAAFVRVSQELGRTCPILAKELGRVSKDIMSGIPRSEAFRALANRNNVPDLRSFVALLIQTDKLGTSIAQSLRVYSDTMRTKRRQRAEKLAAQASVKMVIPLVLFVLPSMFVVLLAPAALTLAKNFKNMNVN
ncbi:MAG: hypothetical protein A2287_07350 [Candidatus Melainabacteria bacterium RIFOXYA12_FULL_32_12]|nr:MAG: hypothetical protein A2255_02115 [Candidatus Melainabacteria bacterium RIFOXYA2_FULL_32_9]OGI30403.1 MAG: hypothetical protein A2287_07350 [Candidatus Melainabacteria bacterium RIFOXYA12_FULL_32_12]